MVSQIDSIIEICMENMPTIEFTCPVCETLTAEKAYIRIAGRAEAVYVGYWCSNPIHMKRAKLIERAEHD